MVNVREDALEVHFTVEKDGETVYDQAHRLDGTKDGPTGRVEITENWMGEDADYNVTVSIPGENRSNRFSTDDAADFVSEWGDNDCFSLTATPEEDGIYFSIGALDSCP